jgi:hypothetical protein
VTGIQAGVGRTHETTVGILGRRALSVKAPAGPERQCPVTS